MSGYQLYYFPILGRAERARWAFAVAKIDLIEDVRLSGEEWANEKASGRAPFGQMPFLVTPEGKVLAQSGAIMKYICKKGAGRPPLCQMPFLVTPEGKILAQSGAIMKYICKKAGLSPSDSFDEAVADMIHDGATDLRDLWLRIYYFEKDEARKETQMKEYLETTLPARLEKYEALLKSKDDGKGFFLGAKLSYADISFVEFINSFTLMVKKQKDDGKPAPDLEELFKKFPLLDGHYKRVLDVPEIKAWVEKRPPSDL